jgi:cytidylate kinase
MFSGFQNVLTVDGASGTGKTTLLRSLAERYDCTSVELGPVVRTISWLVERRGLTVADAVAVLVGLNAKGALRIDRPGTGDLAASEIELGGKLLRQQIFSGWLGPATAATSLDREAMLWIHGLIRETVRDHRAAVSAREGASVLCPSAGLRLRLYASAAERANRKSVQLRRAGIRPGWIDDERLLGPATGVHAVIDTTSLTPGQVLSQVSLFVERHLGWSRKPILAAATHRLVPFDATLWDASASTLIVA